MTVTQEELENAVKALAAAIRAEIEFWGGSWYDRTPEDLARALIDRARELVPVEVTA